MDNWIAGPTLNIFNPVTLQLMIDSGVRHVGRSLRDVGARRLAEVRAAPAKPIETEVFAYVVVLPLAPRRVASTARHFNLQKDTCEFRCLSIMDGITLRTPRGALPDALNGVQTQIRRGCPARRPPASNANAVRCASAHRVRTRAR